MQSKITQALVERAPAPDRGKSVLYADSEMRGFYLIVTPTKRSFYVQSLVNGPLCQGSCRLQWFSWIRGLEVGRDEIPAGREGGGGA